MDDVKRQQILDLLVTSYNMEIETIANYIVNSEHLDGVRAQHIKQSLADDVAEELGHAQLLAKRIKTLDGNIPGSQSLSWTQTSLQPPADTLDVLSVIKGVVEAEKGAVDQYQKLIIAAGDDDPVTADLCTTIKADEEEHHRLFKGFLTDAQRWT